MNKTIKTLLANLEKCDTDHRLSRSSIKQALQYEYNKAFENDKALAKALADLGSASLYEQDDSGIYRWFRWNGLDDIEENAREYFEAYVSDVSCAHVDWDNSCFKAYEGESLIIQDDSPYQRDNGVWYEHKLVIDEKEYRDEDDEVDENKRNALIEAWMEKQGFYPGVFRVTRNGDVFFINTQKKGGRK